MTRKQLYITTSFLLLTTFTFGQADTTKRTQHKWTIGTILISETNSYVDNPFTLNFFNGITLKRHFNSFTARLGIEYINLIDKYKVKCCDQISSEGYTNEGMIRIGIEKGFIIKKYYRPYLALDLTGIKSYSDKTFSGGFAPIYQQVITNSTGFGVTPTIGFEFRMTTALSVSLETRLRILYTNTTDEIDSLLDTAGSYKQQDKQWKTTFDSIGGLTLNFNF